VGRLFAMISMCKEICSSDNQDFSQTQLVLKENRNSNMESECVSSKQKSP
jgi:hypothetical protein